MAKIRSPSEKEIVDWLTKFTADTYAGRAWAKHKASDLVGYVDHNIVDCSDIAEWMRRNVADRDWLDDVSNLFKCTPLERNWRM